MKLYGTLASPYVARVVLFARLQGVEIAAEPPEGGIKSPSYLALNPIGKMPVLVDGEAAIAESEVICEYLEDLRPGRALPGTPSDRARARLVSRVFDLYAGPHTGTLFRNLNPATRDAQAVEAAKQGLAASLGHVEHFMAAPYAAGAQASLADCTLLPAFAILKKTAFPALAVDDPTLGGGRLGAWWTFVARDAVLGAFLREYDAAVDAFLRARA